MLIEDPEFARSEVLRVFDHAEIYLFLGVAITTIGLLAAFFSLLRRRFDLLLLWFALFAILYGVRLDLDFQPLWALHLQPFVLQRVAAVIQFLVPIPAFFFFRALDLFRGRGRLLSQIVWRVAVVLAVGAVFFGNQGALGFIVCDYTA
jgi:sigma-B regulation protein RsbU (phosphoserine phosphatase)